uniref:Uncharacterized protein n=1 Tax=Seculamonas ecuadoriensis TaxID=221724 RepID=M4QAV3_SECEC|nr:hypothetical protein L037_mgp22 [Seculamonas ecuadoriensis]AGH24502.1 hypothetical protein [Seculamonas ecuadoriensis]
MSENRMVWRTYILNSINLYVIFIYNNLFNLYVMYF